MMSGFQQAPKTQEGGSVTTFEDWPLCRTRGARRKTDGIFKPSKSPQRIACPVCNGMAASLDGD
jgi:hypothetical protein